MRHFKKNKKGQGLTEYLILITLVVVVCIGAAKGLGMALQNNLKSATRQIQASTRVKTGSGPQVRELEPINSEDQEQSRNEQTDFLGKLGNKIMDGALDKIGKLFNF
jgi:Flp pilus assembly pilin Flp